MERKCEYEDDKYDEETPWNIIGSYFENRYLERLVRHQIESFNYFINTQIINTIEMFNPVVIRSDQYYDKEIKKRKSSYYDLFAILRNKNKNAKREGKT